MRISSKLVLFALACSILPLLVAFWLSFAAARASLDDTVRRDLETRAQEELALLQRRLASAKQELRLLGGMNVMQKVAFRDWGGEIQGDLDRFAAASPDLLEILVADESGTAIAATDPAAIGTDLRGTWEYEAPHLGIEFDGPVVRSYRLHAPISTHALPIFDKSAGDGHERVIGALIGSISWEALKGSLLSRTLFGGPQGPGRQIVVQSIADGTILYATPGAAVPDALLEPLAGGRASRDLSMDGRHLLSASVDSVALPPFRDPGWRLHMLLDADIAYASVDELRERFVSVGAVVLAIVILLASLLSRSITRPIASLATAAQRLARGEDDEPLVHGGRDEIGGLARSFESMRRAVRANEQELIHKTEQSEAAARLKGEFLANMSHEVRTPINGVLGMTELLLATELNETQGRYAETIFRSGQSLLSVINDILDFSKIEAGKLEVQDVGFDLRELVEDLFEMVAESAHKKGLELALDMPPGSHVAYRGDSNRIRQILLNLLGNAIKFTESGEVRLEVRAEPLAAAAGAASSENPDDLPVSVTMTVIDTGIGIPESALAGVFESFVQADGSTTRRFGGTGLGLAISSRLAGLMGGGIDVESDVGHGSRFRLHVPLDRLPASVADAWHAPDALAGRRVLVVDDNENNREILETQMRFWGAAPVMANNGVQALARVLEAENAGERFDLVVLDMHMPGMNGLDLSRTLLASGRLGGAPTVLLSSVCDQLDPAACTAAGINSVITKPVRQPELYRCLTALLDGERHSAPAKRRVLATRRLRGRILLAEDNPTNQFMMTEMLRQIGLEAHVAEHGRAAIDALEQEGYGGASGGFDVILMDCQMPVLDGFAASREIRERERAAGDGRHVPIVALTANALEGDREACLEAGMDEYLTKPVSATRLIEQLSVWLETEPDTADTADTADTEGAQHPAVPAAARAEERSSSAEETSTAPVAAAPLHERAAEPDDADPVLDREVYDALVEMADEAPAGFLAELLAAYRASAAEDLEGVRAGLASGDAASVASRAHRLKSSSANWGARRLAACCQTVENTARAGDLEAAAHAANALEPAFAEVIARIDPGPERKAA